MIVKVQKPIMPPDGPVLVYDQYRRVEATIPMNDQLRKLLGKKVKVYCEATKRADEIIFGRLVPDRDW